MARLALTYVAMEAPFMEHWRTGEGSISTVEMLKPRCIYVYRNIYGISFEGHHGQF